MVKNFLKIFAFILLIDILLGVLSTVAYQVIDIDILYRLASFLLLTMSFPLKWIDPTYPFYAEGSVLFGLSLTIGNIILQTFLIMGLKKLIKIN